MRRLVFLSADDPPVVESSVMLLFDDREIPNVNNKRADAIRKGDYYAFVSGGAPREISRVEVYNESDETWNEVL